MRSLALLPVFILVTACSSGGSDKSSSEPTDNTATEENSSSHQDGTQDASESNEETGSGQEEASTGNDSGSTANETTGGETTEENTDNLETVGSTDDGSESETDNGSESDTDNTEGENTVTFSVCDDITSNQKSPMGINIMGLDYFNSSHWVFVDAFTKASPWRAFDHTNTTNSFDGGTISSFDDNGWPTGVAGSTQPAVQLNASIDGAYPSGTYVIHWQGDGGTLWVDDDASNLRCEDGNAISNCPSQRGFFDVNNPSDTGIFMGILPDDPGTYSTSNYIRDIRVIMPGGVCGRSQTDLDTFQYCATDRGGEGVCDAGEQCFDFEDIHFNRFEDDASEMHNPKIVYHPESVKGLRQYRTIRYQEFMKAQQTTIVNWDDRPRLEDYSWALENGPPPEVIPVMSNIVGAEAWVNIPYTASNDYVDNFASLLLNNLDDSLQVYLEYTNEHWNPSADFPQSNYMLAQAQANNLGLGESDLTRQNLYYAQRAVEIFDRFYSIWGEDANRVTRVMGGWGGFPEVGNTLLSQSGVAEKTDAITIGPYIGIYMAFAENEPVVETWDVDDVYNEIYQGGLDTLEANGGALAQTFRHIDEYVDIANNFGVDLIGYESGTHLTFPDIEENTAITSLFNAVEEDPRMREVYVSLYEYWRNAGGKMINNFAFMWPRRFGPFGNYANQFATCENSPKEQGIQEFILNNDCWWDDCELTP